VLYFDMFVFYDWPFPHMCTLHRTQHIVYFFLILGSDLSDYVVFYGDSIKPAYNQCRLDGWLILTASAFNQLWTRMLAVLITEPTVTQNSLHLLSTSSITARHLLDFMEQGKTTGADAECAFCCNLPNLSWLGTCTK